MAATNGTSSKQRKARPLKSFCAFSFGAVRIIGVLFFLAAAFQKVKLIARHERIIREAVAATIPGMPPPPSSEASPRSNNNLQSLRKRGLGEPKRSTTATATATATAEFASDNEKDILLKCSPWDEHWIDDWWQEHPGWEASDRHTNDTHTCLQPIPDPAKADFYSRLYKSQFVDNPEMNPKCFWNTTNDNNNNPLAVLRMRNYGFAAVMSWKLPAAFWSAFRENRTFRHVHFIPRFHWQYVPQNTSSWAYCPSRDQECYFLPITNCPRPYVKSHLVDPKDYEGKMKYSHMDAKKNKTMEEQQVWLGQFLLRARQDTRQRLYELMKQAPKLETPCAWIHVRRGDIMTEKGYDRNYYSVQDYITNGKIKKGENILLLTDDEAAIEEALLLHPEYNWVYWNRTRHRGEVQFNSHFPSEDKAFEMLVLLAEWKLASRCRQGVHGRTNLAKFLRYGMHLEQGGPYSSIKTKMIDRKLRKVRVEAKDFITELEAKLAAARKNMSSIETRTNNV